MEELPEHDEIAGNRFVEVKLNFEALEIWRICSDSVAACPKEVG